MHASSAIETHDRMSERANIRILHESLSSEINDRGLHVGISRHISVGLQYLLNRVNLESAHVMLTACFMQVSLSLPFYITIFPRVYIQRL
jgi:hypothetical protein